MRNNINHLSKSGKGVSKFPSDLYTGNVGIDIIKFPSSENQYNVVFRDYLTKRFAAPNQTATPNQLLPAYYMKKL